MCIFFTILYKDTHGKQDFQNCFRKQQNDGISAQSKWEYFEWDSWQYAFLSIITFRNKLNIHHVFHLCFIMASVERKLSPQEKVKCEKSCHQIGPGDKDTQHKVAQVPEAQPRALSTPRFGLKELLSHQREPIPQLTRPQPASGQTHIAYSNYDFTTKCSINVRRENYLNKFCNEHLQALLVLFFSE